jgi:hypothetical protein
VILHWFSETKKKLERAIEDGYFFSVNDATMQSAHGRDVVVWMLRSVLTANLGFTDRITTFGLKPSTGQKKVTWQINAQTADLAMAGEDADY